MSDQFVEMRKKQIQSTKFATIIELVVTTQWDSNNDSEWQQAATGV